jgi:cytoskeleton protein RodZ
MADSEPASIPAVPPTPQTLGQLLRNARLAQDLTLEQLSTELRIEARQLRALEDNRFEQIGVPVFVKGYLKQYGTRLGVNVADLLALYYKQTTLADVQVQPSRTIKLRDERQITSWVIAVIVLLAVAAGLFWWWNGGNFGALPLTRSEPEPATTSVPAAAPAQPAPLAVQPAPQPVDQPPVVPASPPAPDAQAPEAAAATSTALGGAGVDAAAAPAFTAPDEGGDEQAEASAGIPLTFSFEQESWAEVTDARGERLVFGLNAAGRTVRVRGEPPFAVVLGNANVVRLLVDGEPYEIPASGREGELVRFSVEVAGD